MQRDEIQYLQRERDAKAVQSREVLERKRKEKEAREVKKVDTKRSEFRFQDIRIDIVGRDPRSEKGVGARYGIPHQDRKKGQVKIPTRVR